LRHLFALWYFPNPMKFSPNPADRSRFAYLQATFAYLLNNSPAGGDFRVRNICVRGIRN